MLWFWLAIFAYLLFAVNQLWDRYLLRKIFTDTLVYAFYAGILSALVLLAVPFLGFPSGSPAFIFSSLFCGAIFVIALIANYEALQKYEASRIVPAIGGLLPLLVLALSYFVFPGESMSPGSAAAFGMFILGSITITAKNWSHIFSRSFWSAALGAILFAIYFVSLSYAYRSGPSFWAGFLWTRMGSVLAAAAILLFSGKVRRAVFGAKKGNSSRAKGLRLRAGLLFLGNKGLGASATIVQNFAVSLAPPLAVSIINALQGTQYLFLIIIAYVVSVEIPELLKESFSGRALIQKSAAFALFLAGTIILIFYK